MKIIFDRSQEMLKNIVALKDAKQEIMVVCTECQFEISADGIGKEILACKNVVILLNYGIKHRKPPCVVLTTLIFVLIIYILVQLRLM